MEICLSNSDLKVIVDKDVYEYLSQWKWQLVRGYAKRSRKISKKKYTPVTLHREVLKVAGNEKIIFKDSNPLNCTRNNLMIGTQKNVTQHSRSRKKNKTGFKGVHKCRDKYRASIRDGGVSFHLGTFLSKIEAAKAYNNEATKRFGRFATLNQIPVDEPAA